MNEITTTAKNPHDYRFNHDIELYCLPSGEMFADKIAAHLEIALAPVEVRHFSDGEHKIRPIGQVRGRDIYIVQSLYSETHLSVNDKFIQLLFLLGALKDAGAKDITLLVPFLAYSRKDRKTKIHDPTTTRYVASLFEAMGVDRVITLDVHNLAAFQNAFRCETLHVVASSVYVDLLTERNELTERAKLGKCVVVSPDVGGMKRAEAFRQKLSEKIGRELNNAFVEKYRSQDITSGNLVVGAVDECDVLIIDDMIVTGGTLIKAAESLKQHGAKKVIALATHGVMNADCNELRSDRNALLDHPAIDEIIISNTIGAVANAEAKHRKLQIVDITGLCAEVIRCLHHNEPIDHLVI